MMTSPSPTLRKPLESGERSLIFDTPIEVPYNVDVFYEDVPVWTIIVAEPDESGNLKLLFPAMTIEHPCYHVEVTPSTEELIRVIAPDKALKKLLSELREGKEDLISGVTGV